MGFQASKKRSELIQLRFEGRGKPPKRFQVEAWGRSWAETGAEPEGVRIIPMVWREGGLMTLLATRRYLQSMDRHLFFGCPGIVRYEAHPNLILLDYDTEQNQSLEHLYFLSMNGVISVDWIEDHRTARGWHRVIRVRNPLTPLETVTLQAILGSDPRRETYNFVRVRSMGRKSHTARWNILFERKLD